MIELNDELHKYFLMKAITLKVINGKVYYQESK